jgi:hypothetical protein
LCSWISIVTYLLFLESAKPLSFLTLPCSILSLHFFRNSCYTCVGPNYLLFHISTSFTFPITLDICAMFYVFSDLSFLFESLYQKVSKTMYFYIFSYLNCRFGFLKPAWSLVFHSWNNNTRVW